IIHTLIFTLSKPVGGIMFAIAFWVIARSIHRETAVRRYFIMAGFGIILLFTSNQAIIFKDFSFPPFGLVTVCSLGLSTYLFILSIYASAISSAHDEKIRLSIRNSAICESKLIDDIGTAQKVQ